MTINYIQGQILASNLDREGIDLTISNANVGINTLSPASALEVVGNVTVGNILIPNVGNINVGNVNISNLAEPVANTDAVTKFYVDSLSGNVSFSVSDGANSQSIANGDTLNLLGTANQISIVVGATDNAVFSLPTTIAVDSVISRTANGNLVLSANGTGIITASVDFSAGNLQANNITATSAIFAGNITIPVTGNINAGNVNISNVAGPVANADAATKLYVDQKTANLGNANIGNLNVTDTTISSITANANIVIDPNGTGFFEIAGTNGFVMPVGNTAQRPSPVTAGTMRFNNETTRVEYYDGTEWDIIAGGITNQTLNGDGSSVTFVLSRETTSAAILVMLNGVVQLPVVAYNMVPNPSANLVFTEAPVSTDVIDVRFL
jgi:hypothetical protein